MTTVDERPRNGHPMPGTPPRPGEAAPEDTDRIDAEEFDDVAGFGSQAPVVSPRVRELAAAVADRAEERDLLKQLVEIDADPVFDDYRDEQERRADRDVAQSVRSKARRERGRAGKARIRAERRARWQERMDGRAERVRDRILDPARNLGSDHRRWVASATALGLLVAGGVTFMAVTVHDGLVGLGGSWTAYLVEPLASVLLVISLIAQFTARQRGIEVPRRFMAFDGALATASMLLNVVPYGIRCGWDGGDLVAHVLTPLLVIASVTGWHLASGLYGEAIAGSKDDPVTRDRLALLRRATATGQLPADVTSNQVIKYLRAAIPGGIGHEAGRRIARMFLGY